ncbi:3-keto-disaccharide hydrolase [Saccharicrinis sp. 156]|uniref:3-keto-disaccharide hydrolase n=1 Tax=Saccharicrinis sp. 156 TaxID=3417574 RepID=UPI003D33E760
MKKQNFNLLALVTLILLNSCAPDHETNFVKLFNRVNLDGFYLKLRKDDAELASKVFVVEDSMIHVFNDHFPDSIDLAARTNATHGLFYTDQTYSKFILKFEYKWGSKIANNFDQYQYDAGCYYHVVDDKIWPVGIEYQIRYNHIKHMNHTGDFWATQPLMWFGAKDSSRFLNPKDGGISIPKINEVLASKPKQYNALNNRWNKCEVIVMEDRYAIHKLNGEIVNMATNLQLKEGKIGFQSETAEIFYRNIEIRVFDKVVPMMKFL